MYRIYIREHYKKRITTIPCFVVQQLSSFVPPVAAMFDFSNMAPKILNMTIDHFAIRRNSGRHLEIYAIGRAVKQIQCKVCLKLCLIKAVIPPKITLKFTYMKRRDIKLYNQVINYKIFCPQFPKRGKRKQASHTFSTQILLIDSRNFFKQDMRSLSKQTRIFFMVYFSE